MNQTMSLFNTSSLYLSAEQIKTPVEELSNLATKASQLRSSDPNARLLLDEHQASTITNLEVATLRKRRWQGLPPRFYKIGSKIRYDYFELQEFLNSCSRASTTDEGRTGHALAR